jgi:Chloroplast import apparatus Tic20-like
VRIYYSSQFAPLVIFFLLFLAVVKNTKVPHFVRFNCMQVPWLSAARGRLCMCAGVKQASCSLVRPDLLH